MHPVLVGSMDVRIKWLTKGFLKSEYYIKDGLMYTEQNLYMI